MSESYLNIRNVIFRYFDSLHINYTEEYLTNAIEYSPYFPSLYTITTVLEDYKIYSEVFTINGADINQINKPFITYTRNLPYGKDFILVLKIESSLVHYVSDSKVVRTMPISEFLLDWDGVVFIGETNSASGEPNFESNITKQKNKFLYKKVLTFSVFLLLALIIYKSIYVLENRYVISVIIILITKSLGLTFTIFLVIDDYVENKLGVQKFCSAFKATNCYAVIKGPQSTILGVKWSECGLFYFSFTLLIILNNTLEFHVKFLIVAISSFLAVPFILYSLYMQKVIIKQWCSLCLSVISVLFLEIIWSLIYFENSLSGFLFDLNVILTVFTLFLIPPIIWYLLKSFLVSKIENTNDQKKFKRLLNNPDVFKNLLSLQTDIPDGWSELGITIGNAAAPNIIVYVASLFCNPCSIMYDNLIALIDNNKNYQLKIIFKTGNEISAINMAQHFIILAENNESEVLKEALHDWYRTGNRDIESFKRKYPISDDIDSIKYKIDAMIEWCEYNSIYQTPTVFINYKMVPEYYTNSELNKILGMI